MKEKLGLLRTQNGANHQDVEALLYKRSQQQKPAESDTPITLKRPVDNYESYLTQKEFIAHQQQMKTLQQTAPVSGLRFGTLSQPAKSQHRQPLSGNSETRLKENEGPPQQQEFQSRVTDKNQLSSMTEEAKSQLTGNSRALPPSSGQQKRLVLEKKDTPASEDVQPQESDIQKLSAQQPTANKLKSRNNAKQNLESQTVKNVTDGNKLLQDNKDDFKPIDAFFKNPLENFEKAKFATKSHGLITSYSANTHQGIQRNYNEDRVSIILNMTKPASKAFHTKEWPKCSFFAIYDGHGGNACADFLKDNLHTIILNQESFPSDPAQALTSGCLRAEQMFLQQADSQMKHERSGSCGIIVLIVDMECYVANVGDSRAIMSSEQGKKLFLLSRDHRPNEEYENQRIVQNGGSVYQTQSIQHVPVNLTLQQITVLGPHRVLPGRLSVSRTFGDIEAKLQKYGGKEGVIIAQPEISQFTVRPDFHDFIILGCDGVFDRLTNQNALDMSWDVVNQLRASEIKNNSTKLTIHEVTGQIADQILTQSAVHKSYDNLTVVIISFKNLENFFMTRVQASQDMDAKPQQIPIREVDPQNPLKLLQQSIHAQKLQKSKQTPLSQPAQQQTSDYNSVKTPVQSSDIRIGARQRQTRNGRAGYSISTGQISNSQNQKQLQQQLNK